MGFFKNVFAGMLIGALVGVYASTSLFPIEALETSLLYTEVPILGEINRLVAFFAGMVAVIGGGFAAFLSS